MADKFDAFLKAGGGINKSILENKAFDSSIKKSKGLKFGMVGEVNIPTDDVTRIDYVEIPLSKICGRYENLYIIDPDTVAGLMTSIKKDGLLQPISVTDIKLYLESKKTKDEKEITYLKKRLDEGFEYFIDIGHSRYRAFASLALGHQIMTQSDMEQAYIDLRDPSKIVDPHFASITAHTTGISGYDESNIHARRTTNFEITLSIYNYIIKNNLLDELKKKYNATDRQGMAYVIRMYAMEQYHKELAESGIRNYLRMKELYDDTLMQMIFDGKFPLRDAQAFISLYQRVKARGDLDKLYEDLNNGTFKFSAYKKEYGTTVEKKVSYTVSDLVSFIYDIDKGKRTVKDVIKMIEELNK